MFLQDVLKTSWRCLEDIFVRRLEEVLKTYEQDEYIGLDQDVFWRRLTKENIFSWSSCLEDVLKMSFEDEDERRLH